MLLSVEDTDKKSNLCIRKEETEKIAKETGPEQTVQQHVAKSKAGVAPARTLQVQQVLPQMSQKCSPASSNLRHQSGCLMSQAMHPVECLRLRLQKPKHQRHHLQETESQRAKSPRPATPKAESPRRAAPKAKADTPKAAAKATTEEPAQKAARTSEPKSVPVAKSPAAPPAAKVMRQTAKVPAKEMP